MTTTPEIKAIRTLQDNYVWAIIDRTHHTATVVDPGEAQPVHAYLSQHGLSLTDILITHHHWDHTNGAAALKQEYHATLYGPANDPINHLTVPLHNNDNVQLANHGLSFKVIAIPGHTLGHIAYYAPGILFCGDTLFSSGCGRIFEGTAEQMYQSLQTLAALPPDTHIYCGHEYTLTNLRFAQEVEPDNVQIIERIRSVREKLDRHEPSLPSTMQNERQTNPFLRCQQPAVIHAAERFAGRSLSDPVAVFAALRKWKDGFK